MKTKKYNIISTWCIVVLVAMLAGMMPTYSQQPDNTTTENAGKATPRLDFKGQNGASIGVLIRRLSDDSVLYQQNPTMSLLPASIMKSLTTATITDTLGVGFRFDTKVMLHGYRDENNPSTWIGNLVIKSSGDPTLDSESFRERMPSWEVIINNLKKLGIDHITGDIYVEETMPNPGPIETWELSDIPYPYGAGLFGLNFNDNVFKLYPNTGVTVPKVPELEYKKVCGSGSVSRSATSDVLTVYYRNKKTLKNRNWNVTTTMVNPAEVYCEKLYSELQLHGITVDRGEESDFDNRYYDVCTIQSPKAVEIMGKLMETSNNLFAEGMLRTLAPDSVIDVSTSIVYDYWRNKGLITDSTMIKISDGSGLSRHNRLTPLFLSDVLKYMSQTGLADEYVGYFPVCGRNGTVRNFLVGTPLEGNVVLKSGSMKGVATYAGYKIDPETKKPTHTIVLMVNNFGCTPAQLRAAYTSFLNQIFKDNI